MNLSMVYSKTGKGARALASKSLSPEQTKVLSKVNGKLSAGELLEEIGKLSEEALEKILGSLEQDEYIRAVSSDDAELDSGPGFEGSSVIEVAEISAEEFMRVESEAHGIHTEDKKRQQLEAEARAKAFEEEQRLLAQKAKEQEEAERQLLMVTDMLANSELAEKIDIEKLARNEQLSSVEARKAKEAEKAAAKEAHIAKRKEEKRLAKEQAEAKAKVALEKERLEAEQREIEAAMARTRAEAETRSKREAEEQARREAERKAREEEAMRAKALAEERARQEAEEKARMEAERKARLEEEARLKREAEERARIEAERRAREEAEAKAKREAEERARREAEARAKEEAKQKAREEAEARARQLAEEKARLAAEKQARKAAEEAIKAEAKRKAREEAEARALVKAEEKARRRAERTPIDFSGWIAGSGALAKTLFISIGALFVLLLVAVHFLNLTVLIGPIERLATSTIKSPVRIAAVNASLWPTPHLVLESVTIGKTSEVKVSKVHISPVLATIFEDTKELDTLEFDTATLEPATLAQTGEWLGNAQSSKQVIFKEIAFNKIKLQAPDLDLKTFNGTIKLTDNQVEHIALRDESRRMHAKITPVTNGYRVTIEATDWTTPIGAPLVFDSLKAEGIAQEHALRLERIDAALHGGKLTGSMSLDWSAVWQATGDFELEKVRLQEVSPAFSSLVHLKGHLNAKGSYTMSAEEFAHLADTPQVTARFDASQGYLGGIDLVRAMHAGAGQSIGGTTRFDSLSGNLTLQNGHYQYRQVLLDGGQLKADGEFDIFADQNLTGRVHTQLNIKNRPMQANYHLSGKTGSVSLK